MSKLTAEAAVIDIGTNSIKMVAASRGPDGGLVIVKEGRIPTRLGEGLSRTGTLSQDAMDRSAAALAILLEKAVATSPRLLAVVGTAALREAKNGETFLQRVKKVTGIPIEIISGEREAQLAYSAVHLDPSLPLDRGKPLLVFDIGGGSTELICGAGDKIRGHESFAMGAVRFTERFLGADPPSDAEYARAIEEAKIGIEMFTFCRGGGLEIVGVGGSVTSAASVILAGVGEAHGLSLTGAQVAEISRRLRGVPLSERRQVPGLEPARADIILGGLAILEALLGSFAGDCFLVSSRGIRYGLLMELLGEG